MATFSSRFNFTVSILLWRCVSAILENSVFYYIKGLIQKYCFFFCLISFYSVDISPILGSFFDPTFKMNIAYNYQTVFLVEEHTSSEDLNEGDLDKSPDEGGFPNITSNPKSCRRMLENRYSNTRFSIITVVFFLKQNICMPVFCIISIIHDSV